MNFDQARRIVEARLYAYGVMRLEYPGPAVSDPSKPVDQTRAGASAQEAWVTRHAAELQNTAVIERVLKSLPDSERELVQLRYFEHRPWRYIARRIHVSYRAVFDVRDRAIAVFAYEFGLTRGEPVHQLPDVAGLD